jgi:hypothetical protein
VESAAESFYGVASLRYVNQDNYFSVLSNQSLLEDLGAVVHQAPAEISGSGKGPPGRCPGFG